MQISKTLTQIQETEIKTQVTEETKQITRTGNTIGVAALTKHIIVNIVAVLFPTIK